jgi:uncharacterized membrane protein YccC
MPAAVDQTGPAPDRSAVAGWMAALANGASAAGPPLLFGLRLWASVCLALLVAFWLELDSPYWAGTSAGLVCQPQLGASMRKGWFRMIGTVVGAVFIVALTACFPQSRVGFLLGLALWGAACALGATLLRNFAAYSAALAGYTAAIVAGDELGATGGANGEVFTLAGTRASEICIGIVCAGVVLAGTDFGDAPRRLAARFAALLANIANRFVSAFAPPPPSLSELPAVRRELIREVIALDPVIDQAIGESSTIRYRSPILQEAVDGLFAALAAWRTVAARLRRLPADVARREAGAVLSRIPQDLRSDLQQGTPALWLADPTGIRRQCDAAVRALVTLPASTRSLRMIADQAASALMGLSHVLDGLALLVSDQARIHPRGQRIRFYVPAWLPAFVNGGRAFVAIVAAELFWIETEWPDGTLAITFAAIAVTVLVPAADEVYSRAVGFTIGVGLAAACAAIWLFALLPNVETYAGFCIMMALALVPLGATMAQPWQTPMFAALAGNFVPLLAPTNEMSYDTVKFYNSAIAIVAGCGVAAMSFRLLPPLSPAFRTRRLLAQTLRDLRRLAIGGVQRAEDWQGRIYSRLAAMPDQAAPVERARLLRALSVGTEIIHLRRITPQLRLNVELDSALTAFAHGDSVAAVAGLDAVDRGLASVPGADARASIALRARGRLLAIRDALVTHPAYFDRGEAD